MDQSGLPWPIVSFARSGQEGRARAAIGAALVQALLGYALVVGLGVAMPGALQRALAVFDVAEVPPPAPPPPIARPPAPRRAGHQRPQGGSPPNLRAMPTEIVAPQPVVALPVPTPIAVAPIAGTGSDPAAGAADIPGPGTGTGGSGNGSGTGKGDGDGDGDGGGTPPRHLRGRLRDGDYPRGLGEAGIEGTVSVRYTVELDGRVTDCRVTRSSGSAALDETTCRLIEQRFRFAPSRDRAGRPVRSQIVENHSWIVHDEPAEAEEGRRE
jgi:protein TonB